MGSVSLLNSFTLTAIEAFAISAALLVRAFVSAVYQLFTKSADF